MQMSHAINMAFVTRDVSKLVGPNSVRPRPNDKATIARASNTEFYYLASVDEMKRVPRPDFRAGPEDFEPHRHRGSAGNRRVHGHSSGGVHTEIWTGDNFHQTFMKNNFASLKMPNVWFWRLGDPTLDDI
jgi:hypothetical protein